MSKLEAVRFWADFIWRELLRTFPNSAASSVAFGRPCSFGASSFKKTFAGPSVAFNVGPHPLPSYLIRIKGNQLVKLL